MMPATILVLPYPSSSGTWGSTVLLMDIADACRRAGHRVVFHACAPTIAQIRRRGFAAIGFEGAAGRPSIDRLDSFYDVCRILGFDDLAFWEGVMAAETDAIAAVRPDILLSHLRLTAPISAAMANLPLASLAFWATDPRAQGRGDDPLDTLARRLASAHSDLTVQTLPELVSWHADAQLATSFPAFEPELAGAPGLAYTGYLGSRETGSSADLDHALPDRMILGYMSSAPWGVRRVAEALATAAARIGAVAWCVSRAGGMAGELPYGGRLIPYLPFDRVLPRAAAVVFHGGHGTAMAAMHNGIPSIAVPGANYERRRNAEQLQDLGVARLGELPDLRPGRLAALLASLLDDPALRSVVDAVRRLAQEYQGTATAVEVINRLIDGERPSPFRP